jgi:hypothetical protein
MFNISYSPGLWAFKITIKFRSKSLAMKKEILASVTNTNFNLDCLYSYNVEVLHLQYTKGNNTWWGGLEAIIHSIIICADIILSDNSHHYFTQALLLHSRYHSACCYSNMGSQVLVQQTAVIKLNEVMECNY